MMLQRLFIAAMLVFAAPAPHGAERMQAVTEEFPPFNYTEQGKLTGYSVEMVQALLERSGIDASMTAYPWARAYEMALHQPNVLLFSVARTPQREKLFHWIAPLAKRKVYLYKLATRTDIRLSGLHDVARYSVGAVRGDVLQAQLEGLGMVAGKNLDLSDMELANVRKLAMGRVDLVAETEPSMLAIAAAAGLPMERVERTILLPGNLEYYVAASLKTPDTNVQSLRAGYQKLRDSSLPKRLAEKYPMP